MAFDEYFIDQVNGLPAVAGRTGRSERRGELRTFCGLPSCPPAGQTPGLARQIIECQLEGLEPAGEAFGIDKAIGGRRSGIGGARARFPQGCHPGIACKDLIIPEDMDARRIARVFSAAWSREVFPRIEELEGGS